MATCKILSLFKIYFSDPFTTLLHKADVFFKKFSLKRLKLGTIIDFIAKLGMKESANKMAEVMKTIKVGLMLKSMIAHYKKKV
jgi:hypothetical protein